MTASSFIGLYPFQWLAVIIAALLMLLLTDAWVGHYRSGFVFRAQYAPLVSGGLLIIAALAATAAPKISWVNQALRGAGGLAIASGLIGLGFHHYYGIAKKPGSYKWLLHYLMYGAPQLAPLALAMSGVLAVIAARGLAGDNNIGGFSMRVILLILVAIGLAGAISQSMILHYRGAFNNLAMYAPLTAPLFAAGACAWIVIFPTQRILFVLTVLLWLTFLVGFIGLGMHLRGLGRQMGGLLLSRFNLLEGPPAWAPGLFTGLAAVGLVTVYLL